MEKIEKVKWSILSVNSLITTMIYMIFMFPFRNIFTFKDVSSSSNAVLFGTRTFTINITNGNIRSGIEILGNAFCWSILNEVVKNCRYFIIGIKYIRTGVFGFTHLNGIKNLRSIIKVNDGLLYPTVVIIGYEPIFKIPLSNEKDSVGVGEAYESFSIELHGYEYWDSIQDSYNTYYCRFDWSHHYVKTNQNWLNKKAWAVLVKVTVSSGFLSNLLDESVYLWDVWMRYICILYFVNWNEEGQEEFFKLIIPVLGDRNG